MIKLLTGMVGTLLACQAMAQSSAVYMDDAINISLGAVVTEGDVTAYRDIRLVNEGNGLFRLAAAEPAEVATIDSIAVSEFIDADRRSIEVVVEGHKSVPCVEVLEPMVNQVDDTFHVVLAESEQMGVCAQVLTPFETSFTLDVSDLGVGTYTVNVNGVEEDFTLL